MSKRREARELALKILFQVEVGRAPVEEALATALEQVRPDPETWRVSSDLVRGVAAAEPELDRIIGGYAEGWKLDRLAKVDKNVLRLALYELIHMPGSPASVVVNDAVEIVKKYSMEDSGRFVNGILGSYLRQGAPGTGGPSRGGSVPASEKPARPVSGPEEPRPPYAGDAADAGEREAVLSPAGTETGEVGFSR